MMTLKSAGRQRVVLVAPAGFGDAARAVAPDLARLGDDRRRAGRELADADDLQQVVAVAREHVREPRRELGRRDVGLHVQEVQADALRQRALGVEREQRVVGAVAIEMRGAVGGRARRREAAFVEMRREPQARRVAHRVLRAALLVRERLPLPQLVQRARRRVRRLEAARDRAVGADLDAGLLEEPLAERVRHRRARERHAGGRRDDSASRSRARRASGSAARRAAARTD